MYLGCAIAQTRNLRRGPGLKSEMRGKSLHLSKIAVGTTIALLERGWRFPKRARDYHLRRAYALADLYERSGMVPKARDLFVWVNRQNNKYGDVASRVQALQ